MKASDVLGILSPPAVMGWGGVGVEWGGAGWGKSVRPGC